MMNGQRFYNEIKGSFCLRTRKGDKPQMIYFIVRIDGKQYKLSTGVKVYPKHWHKCIAEESNLLCKRDNTNNKIANSRLTEILRKFEEFKLYLCSCDNIADMGILLKSKLINKQIMKEKNETTAIGYIWEAFNSYYSYKKVKKSTIDENKRKLNTLFIPYVEEINDKSINVLKQEGFTKWVNWVQTKTTQLVAKQLITFVCSLIEEIMLAHPNLGLAKPAYRAIKVDKEVQKKNEGKPLSKEELAALENYVPKKDSYNYVKILFLIGCYSGARSSDWQKIINGEGHTKATEDGSEVFVIEPKKTQKKGNSAFITITPELRKYIDEARKLGIQYYDRDAYEQTEKSKDNYTKRITSGKVSVSTFHYALKAICEQIYNNDNSLFGRTVYKKGENIPFYKSISTHCARHTFVHNCKLAGLNNETIAKKIGDSVQMVEEIYGFMNKTEVAESIIKEENAIKDAAKGNITNEAKVDQRKQTTTLINAFFAYDDVVSLIDMKESGISIYDDARLKKAISVIKGSVSITAMDKAIKMVQNGKEKTKEFKEKVLSIERFVWNIGKYFSDTKLYMMYQYKLNKLGLLENQPLDEEILVAIWEQEVSNDELEHNLNPINY